MLESTSDALYRDIVQSLHLHAKGLTKSYEQNGLDLQAYSRCKELLTFAPFK